MDYDFRIFDFHLYNKTESSESDGDDSSSGDGNYKPKKYPKNLFTVQMFGKNEQGESCSITVADFKTILLCKSWR